MSIAVRFYSRSGNTKLVAEAIAKAADVAAIPVDAPGSEIEEPTDILFIGGALYAYGLDKHLKEFLAALRKEHVKKAVVFSTSWISKHSVALIKKALAENGIPVEEAFFHVRNKPSEQQLTEAEAFARKFL